MTTAYSQLLARTLQVTSSPKGSLVSQKMLDKFSSGSLLAHILMTTIEGWFKTWMYLHRNRYIAIESRYAVGTLHEA
jgi:hypothetical protein